MKRGTTSIRPSFTHLATTLALPTGLRTRCTASIRTSGLRGLACGGCRSVHNTSIGLQKHRRMSGPGSEQLASLQQAASSGRHRMSVVQALKTISPLHPAHLGTFQNILCRQVVALVDERAPEGVWTLHTRAGGGEFGGDVDGNEAASWAHDLDQLPARVRCSVRCEDQARWGRGGTDPAMVATRFPLSCANPAKTATALQFADLHISLQLDCRLT